MPSYSSIPDSDATESIIVDTTVATLTLPNHYSTSGVNAGRARIRVQAAPILYTLNGDDPIVGSQRHGELKHVGDSITLHTLAEMNAIKMVQARAGAGNEADVLVQYDRRIN